MMIIMLIIMIKIIMTIMLILVIRVQLNKTPKKHDNSRTADGQLFVNAVGPHFWSPLEVPKISKTRVQNCNVARCLQRLSTHGA